MMDAERPIRCETAGYTAVRDAVWDALPSWRRYIVAIDGRDGVGKSSLARYLAWQLGMTAIELDVFRDMGKTSFDFRIDDLSRALDARLGRGRPVVVEGITVLRVLEQLSLKPDYVVFVEHDDPALDHLDAELDRYLRQYEPEAHADYRFRR